MGSCVSPGTGPKTPAVTPPHLENLVEVQRAPSLKPGEKASPKPESRELTITQAELEPKIPRMKGARITLSAQDVDVKTILLALSKEIKQNIVIDPEIDKKATVDLKGVTLTEALESLLRPLHLKYEIDKDFIRVAREKMQSRVFRLNYIISKRIGTSNVQASSGSGVSGTGGSSSGATGGTSSGGSSAGGQRTSSSIVTSEESDLWKEIVAGVQQSLTGATPLAATQSQTGASAAPGAGTAGATGTTGAAGAPGTTAAGLADSLLGAAGVAPSTTTTPGGGGPEPTRTATPAERGVFSINRQAGVIVVKDYPDVLIKVAEFLEAIEGSVHRQVFIQAKILEVTLNNDYKLGIDWSQVSPITISNATGVSDPLVGGYGFVKGAAANFTYGLSSTRLNVVVDALNQQGKVSVLSSPKIATLNNQRAVIKVGTEDVFFIPETTTIQGATTTQFVPETVTIGIVLDVLPQINANGMVMMSINTSISEKTGEQVSPDGKNKVPILDVRESNSVVLARNGQTIVIGGLMKNKVRKKKDGVPLLGEIPVIGRVFQREEDIDDKTELVIMLTPEVMAGLAVDDRLKEEQGETRKFEYPARTAPANN
ncbi:MAG: secretin N-terminal domain-containing protein [Nitrospinae bacterium]|nr:secretin N-terminal domain-containing protein [Nitrospinota bacterium]